LQLVINHRFALDRRQQVSYVIEKAQ